MRAITFDIETTNTFQDAGSNDPADLDIAVVCIHDPETGRYDSFEQKDFPKLWPIIESADALITFNGDHFDIPLLNKHYSGDLTKIKSIDLMREIRDVLGRRIKLDTIAEATLGKKKIGHGLDAITWWKEGNKNKVIQYCIEDVKITRELFDYAIANKKLLYKDLGSQGTVRDIKLDTSKWLTKNDHAMTFTLPF